MIIDNKEVKGLLKKEAELLESIKEDKERVAELTAEMREIQVRNEEVLTDIADTRKEYTKLAVPLILESLKENEMFSDIELIDGNVEYKVVDVLEGLKERAITEVAKQKEDWVNYITPKEDAE